MRGTCSAGMERGEFLVDSTQLNVGISRHASPSHSSKWHDGSPRRLASFGIFPNVTSIVTKLGDSVSFCV
jgi:hypothetical protein